MRVLIVHSQAMLSHVALLMELIIVLHWRLCTNPLICVLAFLLI